MNRTLMACASIIIFMNLSLYAEKPKSSPLKTPTGFQEIPFGEEKERTIAKLEDSFNINPNFGASEEGIGLKDYSNFAILSNFTLGDRLFDVYFFFNKDEKFYSYEFRGEKKNALYLDTDIKEEALYLSRVFEKKFGPPSIKNDPSILNIKQGYTTFVWKWTRKNHTIYTGLSTYENEYYASATVTDDALEKENNASINKQEAQNIDNAAKGF